MSSKGKISRKELKVPDKFQQVSGSFVKGLAGHRVLFFSCIAALLMVAGGFWVVTEKQKEKSLEMEGLYFQIDQLIQKKSEIEPGPLSSKISNLLAKFDAGPQKTRAQLRVAEMHYKNGEYEKALALYSEVEHSSDPSDTNHTLARQGSAFCFEGQKKYSKAIEIYKSIIDTSPKFPLFYVYLGLSRSYQLNQDNKSAILILREMQSRFPKHGDIKKILSKLKELEGQT